MSISALVLKEKISPVELRGRLVESGGGDGLRCDSLGCVQDIQGQKIAFVRDARALLEDCAEADLVISLVPVKTFCSVPHTIIDRFDFWRNGAHAIWLGESGAHIRTVADMRGDRPWVVRRGN